MENEAATAKRKGIHIKKRFSVFSLGSFERFVNRKGDREETRKAGTIRMK